MCSENHLKNMLDVFSYSLNLPNDVQEENRGPKVGAPEQALNGFMKGQGISDVSMLEQRETPKGTFYFYTKTVEGRSVKSLLEESLPTLIKNIP